MKRQWATIMGAVAAAVLPTIASAGVIMEVIPAADPAPGLQAMYVRAVGTDGLKISSFAGLNLTGAHQVWPAAGDSAELKDFGGAIGGLIWNSTWTPLDSHFNINRDTTGFLTGSTGPFDMIETKDASNPAGLTLQPALAGAGSTGMGTLFFADGGVPSETAQITYSGEALFPTQVDFLYVVVPTGGTALLDVKFIDSSSSGFISYTDFPVTAAVPEPSMGLLALPALAFLRRRRS